MTNDMLNTEERILEAAKKTFLLYGYHATTINKIAKQAGIHKSAIHYYYRTKEKLYNKVVAFVLDNVLKTDANIVNQQLIEEQRWFLFTELYNNKNLFENVLKELYGLDWGKKLIELKDLLENK